MRTTACAALVAFFVATGCVRIGEPSKEERDQLAKWSARVSETDRVEVRREADRHTEWMEKKKTQFMIEQYRERYRDAKAAEARRAATRPAG
jgi:hypothetical protein